MFWIIKQVFTVLYLATKCVSLNKNHVRPTFIDLNELNYYLFMVSPDKCNGS